MPIDDDRLSLALALARDGGRQALARTGRVNVEWKRAGDRITEADLEIQARMVREVTTRFPTDGVVAEEEVSIVGTDREFVWVVDPLDGTNNYALGIPCFTVSIGILREGGPYAGVVHDPNTGFTCHAVRGRGAFAGGRTLSLEPRALSAASNVSIRVPIDPDWEPLVLEWLRRHKLRGFGSVALQLAYAAMGGIELILDHQAALWDIAGGAAVLLEAGGVLTQPFGEPLFPLDVASYRGQPLPFLAGNPRAHAQTVPACRALFGRPKQPLSVTSN